MSNLTRELDPTIEEIINYENVEHLEEILECGTKHVVLRGEHQMVLSDTYCECCGGQVVVPRSIIHIFINKHGYVEDRMNCIPEPRCEVCGTKL